MADVQVSTTEGESTLTSLERTAVGCLLQRTTNQLATVQTVSCSSRFFFRPIKERISDYGSSRIYNCETLLLTEKAYELLEPLTINKIRFFTESVLESVWRNVIKGGTIDSIQEALQQEHLCRAEEIELIDKSIKYTKEVAATENQIKKVLIKSCDKIKEKEVQLAILQDELLDLQYHKEVSLNFTEKRIGAKLSQVSLWLNEHHLSLTQTLDFNILACDLQDRVHVEILNYLDSVIKNLKEQLEYWSNRNEVEVAQMNLKLDKLQQDRSEQSLQLQALKVLFHTHSEEMRLYVQERTEREHKEEMQQRINEMATRIQAWWRGTMVRRNLGPYKADKKKKPKDKIKKKK